MIMETTDGAMNDKPFSRGLVQVYTGSGKGKTTAALGLTLRSTGHGAKVHIIFFMKGGFPYGELKTLEDLSNVSFQLFGHEHFVDPRDVKEEERDQARQALQAARAALGSGKYDIVILDEINVASAWKLIDVGDVVKLIDGKPSNVELVLTGRYADERIIEKADLVTRMEEVKHPYQQKIAARKGIEY